MERARANPEIVDEASASGQQRRIFDARNRLPNPWRAWLVTGKCVAGGFRHP
jgi:hypothetical protein